MMIFVVKHDEFVTLQKRYEHRKAIRGRQVTNILNLYGAYRPHTGDVFGEVVKHVSYSVLADEWMVIEPEETLEEDDNRKLGVNDVSYEQLGKCAQAIRATVR